LWFETVMSLRTSGNGLPLAAADGGRPRIRATGARVLYLARDLHTLAL